MLGVEAKLDARELVEAADQQAGAHEQHHGQANLRDHQRSPSALGAAVAAGSSAAILERIMKIGPRGIERGKDTEQQTGRERERQAEQQHARVDVDGDDRRQRVGVHRENGARGRDGDRDSRNAADRRQKQGFREQLSNEPRAPGAERGSQRHLTPPADGASKGEVGQVRARDEQDHERGTLQQQHGCAQRADHRLVQRHGKREAPGVRVRVLRLEAMGDRQEIGARRLEGDTWLETTDHLHPMLSPRAHGVGHVVAEVERNPRVRIEPEGEARWHDADQLVSLTRERDTLADDGRVGAERALPEVI